MRTPPSLTAMFPLVGLLSVMLPSTARASSSSGGEEYLSITESVPPNIIFLVELSSDMGSPCPDNDPDTGSASTTTEDPCYQVVFDAIEAASSHFEGLRIGVVGTSDDDEYGDTYYPIAPLGSSLAQISSRLAATTPHSTSTVNLAEALAGVANDYLSNSTAVDDDDSDEDSISFDWDEAAIEYWCQETHIITITTQRPTNDENVSSTWRSSLDTDVTCSSVDRTTDGSEAQCWYDNTVYDLYNSDLRSDLADDQNVVVHTVGIGIGGSSVANELFGNATDVVDGDGLYIVADTQDELLGSILQILLDIRSGEFSRSTPVLSAMGDYLVYSFYEMDFPEDTSWGKTLGRGHLRAYTIDDDPTSSTYGEVLLDYTKPEFGYAEWDGGNLLTSRIVTEAETQQDDRNGVGRRDIYTFYEPAYALGGTMKDFGDNDRRMPLDQRFVDEVGTDATALSTILDNRVSTTAAPCAASDVYDFLDDCLVDDADLQYLVDFARGYAYRKFRYMDEERGRWRLGDSPHSVPVIVQARNNNYAVDPTYRKFLDELVANEEAGVSPDIVLIASNAGMLHAFALEDESSTVDTEEGEELWAWVPGYLLYREHDQEWAGRLVDLMLYGRTFLFDGSPVVEDVWIDADDDGVKDCTSVPDDCEWRRIVVVQQGMGGPITLALDITDTNDPQFLWEQWDDVDNAAIGFTTSRPVVGNIVDASDPSDPRDRWVAFWGSGRGVPRSDSDSYYTNAEANLYMWHSGDDYWQNMDLHFQETSADGHPRGDNNHPDPSSSLDTDGDGNYENAYISAALAAVDVDSDGDVDTLYFPMTTTYKPTDEGGGGRTDIADPGSSWMYKACINTRTPGEFTWVEFYDPVDDGELSSRPEVFYAATTSWLPNGDLGIYWGTGTPYSRTGGGNGYFFAMKDTDPGDCSGDSMIPMEECGVNGVITLEAGEGLTADPIIYAGTVYFSTWLPADDRCDGGTGSLYGIDYQDCSPGLDTDGDGDIDSDDESKVEEEDSYISGVAVSDKGTLFYGTSNVSPTDVVGTIHAVNDPFLGTGMIAWLEKF